MRLLARAQEATQNLLAGLDVAAAREPAQAKPQNLEPALAQVGGAQPMLPVRRKGQESQHPWQVLLEFLDHLRHSPAPARAEPPRRGIGETI